MPTSKSEYQYAITPKDKFLDLRLKDIWQYRDLLVLFVRRDFVATYKQTILGPIWFIIQPLLTTIVFTIVFGNIAKLSTDGLPPMLFYLAGVTSWNYFAECLKKSADTFTANAGIFGKVYFPRIIVPLSITITNIITFGIQLTLFLGFLAYYLFMEAPIAPNWYICTLPLLVLTMGLMGLGFGLYLTSMTTKYRDFKFLVAFGVQLLMYATPVIYPVSEVPEKYQWIILANPMTSIIETFRYAFLGAGNMSWSALAYSVGFTLVLFISGLLFFNKTEKNFMDTV
ncbi:MAG: lipopolysaccharide transport system permease protein [Polaribacter sp.]|jgi:lipopolysaccharide transport system permease protein